MVEKYIAKDGSIAVLYSPGFGAGWSTWNYEDEFFIFDKTLVNIVLAKEFDYEVQISNHLKNSGYDNVFLGGAGTLTVFWMDPGEEFRILEHDGYETIEFKNELQWLKA